MSFYDPHTIRPQRNWVSVLMDERKVQLDSGLFLAPNETGAEIVTEGSAIVLRCGSGEKIQALGLKEGDRICIRSYLKHANPIPTEEVWESGKKKEYFLMSVDDIMAVIPPGLEVGVYSRPSQHAVESIDKETGKVVMKS
jgi:co-chaperonin GroES (HSP10)